MATGGEGPAASMATTIICQLTSQPRVLPSLIKAGAAEHLASHGCLTSASQGRLPTAAMVAAEAALAPSPEWIEGGDPGQLRI